MVADIKLLAFSAAKEGIVYWKRTFVRERRLLQISQTRGGVEHRLGEEFPEEFLRLKALLTLFFRIVTVTKICRSSLDFDISFHASNFARSRRCYW